MHLFVVICLSAVSLVIPARPRQAAIVGVEDVSIESDYHDITMLQQSMLLKNTHKQSLQGNLSNQSEFNKSRSTLSPACLEFLERFKPAIMRRGVEKFAVDMFDKGAKEWGFIDRDARGNLIWGKAQLSRFFSFSLEPFKRAYPNMNLAALDMEELWIHFSVDGRPITPAIFAERFKVLRTGNEPVALPAAVPPAVPQNVHGDAAAKLHVGEVWVSLQQCPVYAQWGSADIAGYLSSGDRGRIEDAKQLDGANSYGFISYPVRGWVPMVDGWFEKAKVIEDFWVCIMEHQVYPDFNSNDIGPTNLKPGDRFAIIQTKLDGNNAYGFITSPVKGWVPIGPKPWNQWTEPEGEYLNRKAAQPVALAAAPLAPGGAQLGNVIGPAQDPLPVNTVVEYYSESLAKWEVGVIEAMQGENYIVIFSPSGQRKVAIPGKVRLSMGAWVDYNSALDGWRVAQVLGVDVYSRNYNLDIRQGASPQKVRFPSQLQGGALPPPLPVANIQNLPAPVVDVSALYARFHQAFAGSGYTHEDMFRTLSFGFGCMYRADLDKFCTRFDNFSPSMIDALWNDLDADRDGRISQEEWAAKMRSGGGSQKPKLNVNVTTASGKRYDMLQKLSSGAFGVVWKAQDAQGNMVAIKQIKLSDLVTNPGMVNEVKLHQQAAKKNKYVVQILDEFKDAQHWNIVMELAAGCLHDAIRSGPGGRLDESTAKRYFGQMVKGMEKFHQNGVVHHDIKPPNYLVFETSEGTIIKASDFGLAIDISNGDTMHDAGGTPGYRSPECQRGYNEQHGRGYSGKSADVFALGATLYDMLTGDYSTTLNYPARESGVWSNLLFLSPGASRLFHGMTQIEGLRSRMSNVTNDAWITGWKGLHVNHAALPPLPSLTGMQRLPLPGRNIF